MAVDVTTEHGVQFGAPRKIADTDALGISMDMGMRMAADGQRFLVIKDATSEHQGSIVFVENWAATLEAGQR